MGPTDRTLACPECGRPYVHGAKFCVECGIPLSSLDLDLGTLVGNYRLLEVLGEGGMGRVYVGEHIKLGRRVAIKKLRSELVSNPSAVARFFAEARAVNRISHEHIVEITDFFEQAGGDNYIVMELLKGEDLGQRLQRRRILPLPRALDITAQTAAALSAVHAAGMIHRDLKPDNIFLIERGGNPDFVKVLDFGVAKLIDGGDRRDVAMHVTAAGQIIGTPEYMSPEQAGGLKIDFRTDIYALGVILYEMLTGDLPFQGRSFGELLIQHMTSPVNLPGMAPGLPYDIQAARDQLLLDLLAKNPNNRPASMHDVESRIRTLIDAMDLPPPPKKRAPIDSPTVPMALGKPRSSPGAVARLALIKRPTPQVVVEIVTPRSVSRIESHQMAAARISAPIAVPPAPVEQPQPPGRLARASTDCPADTPPEPMRLDARSREPNHYSSGGGGREPIRAAGLLGQPGTRQATGSSPAFAPTAGTNPGLQDHRRNSPTTGAIPSSSSSPSALTRPLAAVRPRMRVLERSEEMAGGGSAGPVGAGGDKALRGIERSEEMADQAPGGIDQRDSSETFAVDVPETAPSPLVEPRNAAVISAVAAPDTPTNLLRELRDIAASRAVEVPESTPTSLPLELRGAIRSGPAAGANRPSSLQLTAQTSSSRTSSMAESRPPLGQRAAAGKRRTFLVIGALGVIAGAALVASELRRGESGDVEAPVRPSEVRIKFVSAPPGATVRVAGTREPLGITPFTLSFPRSERAMTFELTKPGFVPVTEEVALVSDDALAATLTRTTDPPPLPVTIAPTPAAPPVPAPAGPPVPAPKPERPHRPSAAKTSSSPARGDREVDRNGTLDVFKGH